MSYSCNGLTGDGGEMVRNLGSGRLLAQAVNSTPWSHIVERGDPNNFLKSVIVSGTMDNAAKVERDKGVVCGLDG